MPSIPSAEQNASYLYAIRAKRTRLVKIGITDDPIRRIKRLRSECPHEVIYIVCIQTDRAYDLEQWVHRQLRWRRVRGEWFWMCRDAVARSCIRDAVRLMERGELPKAPPTHVGRLRPKVASVVRADDQTILLLRDRLRTDKSRQAVIDYLAACGHTLTEVRSTVRGENGAIGREYKAARQWLGLE